MLRSNLKHGGGGDRSKYTYLTLGKVLLSDTDDTALQTQDSKFETCRSEAEHATSRSHRLSIIMIFLELSEKKQFVSLKLEGQSGVRTRDRRLSKQAASTTAPGPPPIYSRLYSVQCDPLYSK